MMDKEETEVHKALDNVANPSLLKDCSMNAAEKEMKEPEVNHAELDSIGSGVPSCVVCGDVCLYFCKSCKKASYCSKEHQRKHWNEHRAECYPVQVQNSSVHGPRLVLTRDVRRGEVILRERPLLTAPCLLSTNDFALNGQFSVCVSCSKIISENLTCEDKIDKASLASTTCSKCGWPVCSVECENNAIHAENECKIFAQLGSESPALCSKPAQYLLVALGRALISSYQNSKWSQLLLLGRQNLADGMIEDQQKRKPTTEEDSKLLGSIIHHLRKQFPDADIDQLLDILRTCSLLNKAQDYVPFLKTEAHLENLEGKNDEGGKRFYGTSCSLYHLASFLTSNCSPNCSWLIQSSSQFCLRANTAMKTGEKLTICYGGALLGTEMRRELLWRERNLFCCCSRCGDPTENGTFFSAIKCPAGTECLDGCEGFLLPTDPLASTSLHQENIENEAPRSSIDWKCSVCSRRQPWNYQNHLVVKMRLTINELMNQTLDLEKIEEILTKVEDFARSYFHPNHFLVIGLELLVLEKMSGVLEERKVPLEGMERLAQRMIELCKKGLKMANLLCPGLTQERGRLLFFLQQSLTITLLFKTSRTMRIQSCSSSKESEELAKKFSELLLARKEVHEIFALCLADKDSGNTGVEKKMLKAVQTDSIEMRLLKKHFKFHQINHNLNRLC